MEEFIPGRVYDNLIKMMGYRGVTLLEPPRESSDLMRILNHYEFVTINGKRSADDPRGAVFVIVILIKQNSNYSNKSESFKKLLKGINKTVTAERLDLIFISEQSLTIHLRKLLKNYKDENTKVHIEDYNYEIFMIEAPKHESVPKHTIVPNGEIEQLCKKYYTFKDRFPKINQSDTQAVWLGLRPGDVVRIDRPSENAGHATAYRICVK